MKKISTIYKKNPENLNLVINELNPENKWVIDGFGVPTRKFDGSAAAIINGVLYKRCDVKGDNPIPNGAIPCQEKDSITGHHPHWLKCSKDKPEDKYFFQAFEDLEARNDGTYELCGEKINNNREKIVGHKLILHGCEVLWDVLPASEISFEGLKKFLSNPDVDIEGIVFYHMQDQRMCKIKKRDFGVKR